MVDDVFVWILEQEGYSFVLNCNFINIFVNIAPTVLENS